MIILVLYSCLSIVSTVSFFFRFPSSYCSKHHLCILRTAHIIRLSSRSLRSYQWLWLYFSVACQISNFLLLMKILQITTKKTMRLAVGLVLRDRNPGLC